MRVFPAEESLDMLREIGVRYVVVYRGGYGINQWRRHQEQMKTLRPGSLREVVRFDGDVVYELLAGEQRDSGERSRGEETSS